MAKPRISAQELREKLTYNPETGEFFTKPRKIGSSHLYGSKRNYPAVTITINRRKYYASLLAWLWMTGEWPSSHIDHRNNDSLDNRWRNLRESTRSQNMGNQRMSKRNTSGLTGAFWDRSAKRWISIIAKKHLGTFPSAKAAHEAYVKAARERYGEFLNSRFKRS